MARSLWKYPSIPRLIVPMAERRRGGDQPARMTWSRSQPILAFHVGETVLVHNGKTFAKFVVRQEMVGRKFGEFALTRTLAKHAKAKGKKK